MYRPKKRNSIISWVLLPFRAHGPSVHHPDYIFLSTLGILLFLGLLFLSSASNTLGFYQHKDTYFFVKQQFWHGLVPGLLLFYLTLRLDYGRWRRWYPIFFFSSLVLLALTLITSFHNTYGSAKSWIVIGGLSFQPSEIVKLFFIIFLAAWFERKQNSIKSFANLTLPFLIFLGLISILVMMQPDLGTLSIIVSASLAMLFAASGSVKHIALMIIGGLTALVGMVKLGYGSNRINVWLNPDLDPQNIGWQMKQAMIAIGSGGLFGVGLGLSKQKSYLPMPANDSIFAIIAEELGLVFVLVLLLLFALLAWRGFRIAQQAPDDFGKLVAIGITIWLIVQIFINIGGMIRLLPLTGVPLPLISLGGSNLTITLMALGILANISKYGRNYGK